MTTGYQFHQVDVFTDKPLSGNPLAVFPDSKGLDAITMQKIARETNLSETTFVFPSTDPDADFDVRIFTPGKEIPFAGHPSLGTADVLFKSGRTKPDCKTITLKMGVGNVAIHRREDYWFMEQPLPEFSEPLAECSQVAEALSLKPDCIGPSPVQVVSTGLPALLVPVTGLEAMKRVELNLFALKKILTTADLIYLFTQDTAAEDHDLHSRAFGPFIGIAEDPATGSVSGAMGSYLVKHGLVPAKDLNCISIEQGLEMERPSSIRVEIRNEDGDISGVWVGGKVVPVMDGELTL